MSNATSKPVGTIETTDDGLVAIWTESGPAIFPVMDDLIAARDAGTIEEVRALPEEDAAFYATREWVEVSE